jgi:type III secretion protein C
LLIGGYVIEENSGGKNGVPGLSEVPVLGWLFGQKTSKVRRVERMFMLTPRVVTLSDLTKTPTSAPAPAAAPTSINTPAAAPIATPSSTPTSNAVPAQRPSQVLSLATRR